MSRFTILGGSGFIGARLTNSLAGAGHDVWSPHREEALNRRALGHVIYAIGVTCDFRRRPLDTMAAHVCRLREVLADASFESLVYLSSTRVYLGLTGSVDESSPLVVDPQRLDDLYNLSKLAGESLALACGRPTKVVRIANVYDPSDRSGNFLASVLAEAVARGSVTLRAAPESCRDYVALTDVVSILPRIALEGGQRVYNLSSGSNVSNAELARRLTATAGCRVSFESAAAASASPLISNALLRHEFGFRPRALLDDLAAMVQAWRGRGEPALC